MHLLSFSAPVNKVTAFQKQSVIFCHTLWLS